MSERKEGKAAEDGAAATADTGYTAPSGHGSINLSGFSKVPALHSRAVWTSYIPQDERESKAREYRSTTTISIDSRLAAKHRLLLSSSKLKAGKLAIVENLGGRGSGNAQNVLAWKIKEAIRADQKDVLASLTAKLYQDGTTLLEHDGNSHDLKDGELDNRHPTTKLWADYTRFFSPEAFQVIGMSLTPLGSRPKGMPKGQWRDSQAKMDEARKKEMEALFPPPLLSISDGEEAEWQYSPDHDSDFYTFITVFGVPATLHLPTLGYSIPIAPNDLVGFRASTLLWKLERSREPSMVMTPMYVLMNWTPIASVDAEEYMLNEPALVPWSTALAESRLQAREAAPEGANPLSSKPPTAKSASDRTLDQEANADAESAGSEPTLNGNGKRGAAEEDDEERARGLDQQKKKRRQKKRKREKLPESKALKVEYENHSHLTGEATIAGRMGQAMEVDNGRSSDSKQTSTPTVPAPVQTVESSSYLNTPSESVLNSSAGNDGQSEAHLSIDTGHDTISPARVEAYRIDLPSSYAVEIDEDLIGRFLINAGYSLD